jgi:septum formation protein
MSSSLLRLPPVILASKSPRRQEILSLMGIEFRVELRDADEHYPPGLAAAIVPVYIAEKKMEGFEADSAHSLIITADTVVIAGNEILGKPADEADARRMLRLLSGKTHSVVTGVTLLYQGKKTSFSDRTSVSFRPLAEEEISYYVETCRPADKAGAYGIQEWIGLTAIERIDGSYTNVVGLPSEKLYASLRAMAPA